LQPEDLQPPAGRPKIGEFRTPALRFFDRFNQECVFPEDAQYILYRIEPITDRVAQGKPKFLRIYAEKIDENTIMKDPQAGSGVYQIWAKKRKKPDEPLTFAGKLERLDIENPAYPPCIETGDWLDDKRNLRWEWARKIYAARLKVEKDREAAEELRKAPQPTMTVQDTIAIVEQALDKKIFTGLQRQDSPRESVLDAVKIGMEMARPATDTKGTDRSFDLMMSQLNALREENRDMTKRYLDLLAAQTTANAPAQPKSTTEQLEETARLIDAVEKIRPRRGTTQEQHPVLDLLERLAVPIVEQAAPIIGIAIQRGMQAQPKPAQRATPPAPAQPPAPTTAVQTQQPQPTTNANGETMYPIPKVIQEHFLTAFERMQPPFEWDGEMFANWLNAGYPTALGALRQVGSDWNPPMAPVDAILRLAKQTTVIWSMIEPVQGMEARLRQFLAECITFDQEHFDARSEPETETEEAPQ
jgi:hypothetical protein